MLTNSRDFFATIKLRKTTGGSRAISTVQADLLVRKPALCAQVRGIFVNADAVARRKVR